MIIELLVSQTELLSYVLERFCVVFGYVLERFLVVFGYVLEKRSNPSKQRCEFKMAFS